MCIRDSYKIKPPFNVNKFAQDCAVEALYDNKHIKNSINIILIGVKKLRVSYKNMTSLRMKLQQISFY